MAALVAAGRIDVNSPVAVREALAVMMTRAPAVSVAAFATLDLQLHRAVRHPDGTITRDTISLTDLPRGLERFRQLQTSHSTFWGELFWSQWPEAAACSTCARRCGASTMPSSAAWSPRSPSATCPP